MEKKLHSFLNSGLLEKYLIGDTTIAEAVEVEHHIDTYDEVKDAYDELQKNLEIVAKANAVEAPYGMLNKILDATEEDTKVVELKSNKRMSWYSIAASITALGFAYFSYTLYNENKSLYSENNVVVDEIFDLRSDIEKNNSQLNELALELQKLNNPDAQKYVFTGNERAKDLKTVAYINPVEKTSMIDVVTLPKLPEEQYYQIWAEFQDKMVNLGILDETERRLREIPYMEDALALSITIENRNGNIPGVDNEVAEILLNK